MSNKIYDIIVIGAGPIGLSCGIEAKKNGLDYLIIDKGTLTHSIYNYPLHMVFFSTSEKLEIGGVPFISHGAKPNRSEALEYYRRVAEHWKLNINLYEDVSEIRKQANNYEVKTEKGFYRTRNIIIASGFYQKPALMNIPGEKLEKVSHFFREGHPYIGQKLIVAGGGNSAVDAALECYRKGAEVTMVILKEELEENVKYWIKPDILNRIKEGSIKAYFGSYLTEIRKNEADIQTPDGSITVENDFILALTGYKPDFSLLVNAGVKFTDDELREPVYDPDTLETNLPGVYVAGVICGGYNTQKFFIENTRHHAGVILKDIMNKRQT